MLLKSRVFLGMTVALVMLALVPGAFAQVNLQIFPNSIATEVGSSLTAEVNDFTEAGSAILISGSVIATAIPVTETRLIINFGVPITASVNTQVTACPGFAGSSFGGGSSPAATATAIPTGLTGSPACPAVGNIPSAGDAIRISGGTGIFGGTGASLVSIFTINYASGIIQIGLPELDPTSSNNPQITVNSSGSFRISGIRLDVSGVTGSGPVNASVSTSSSVNNYILSTSSFTAITSLMPGIATVQQVVGASGGVNNGTFTFLTNGTNADTLATFRIGEGYPLAWRNAATYADGGMSNGTVIRLTFAGVPAGITLTLSTQQASTGLTATYSGTVTSTNLTRNVTLTMGGTNTTTSTEYIAILITTSTATPAPTGLTPGAITVTASMGPVGAAFAAAVSPQPGQPTNTDGYPKYAALEVGPATVGNIVSANTTLLMPYGFKGAGFDTGIAISNTSKDHFTAGGAVAGTGTITVTMYPSAVDGTVGTPISLTTGTSVRPGDGLDSSGQLAAGATWVVSVGQLLTAASQTGDFRGYIFIEANFLQAHGVATISNFTNTSLAANVLVMPTPSATPRAVPETLTF